MSMVVSVCDMVEASVGLSKAGEEVYSCEQKDAEMVGDDMDERPSFQGRNKVCAGSAERSLRLMWGMDGASMVIYYRILYSCQVLLIIE